MNGYYLSKQTKKNLCCRVRFDKALLLVRKIKALQTSPLDSSKFKSLVLCPSPHGCNSKLKHISCVITDNQDVMWCIDTFPKGCLHISMGFGLSARKFLFLKTKLHQLNLLQQSRHMLGLVSFYSCVDALLITPLISQNEPKQKEECGGPI